MLAFFVLLTVDYGLAFEMRSLNHPLPLLCYGATC
jgi:hypothetical protein